MKRISKIIMLIFLLLLPCGNVYADEMNAVWPEIEEEPYGKSAILMEADTGAVIYAKDIDEKLYPASITKIMTGLLAVENLKLNDTVTFTREMLDSLPYDAAIQGVSVGEVMTVKDCLYSLMLRSNNDMAVALAYTIAGSEEEFGKMMTNRAKEIGAVNTNFVNASGLHDENHYTTARDMALITREAMSNPTFAAIFSTSEYELSATNKSEAFTIWHRHNMLVKGRADYYQYAVGGKTGYTDQAGRTLVTAAEKDGMKLISVIMFSSNESIFTDTRSLFNYGFNNFHKVTISDNEERFGQSSSSGFSLINRIYGNETSLLTMGSGSVVIPNGLELKDISYTLDMDIQDSGKGEVAQVTYVHDGYELGTAIVYGGASYSNAAAISSIEKNGQTSSKTDIEEIMSLNIYYIMAGVVAAVILLFVIKRMLKKKRRRRELSYYGRRGIK